MEMITKLPTGWRWFAIGAATLGLAALLYATLVPKPDPSAKLEKFLTTVQKLNTDIRITSAGQVFPNRTVNVGPKEAGVLAELYVEQGQKVEKGHILARMDTSRVIQVVAQTKAALENAQARQLELKNGSRAQEIIQSQADVRSDQSRVAVATDNYRRYQSLYKDGGLTADEFNAKKLEFEQAKSVLIADQQRLSLKQVGTRYEQLLAEKAEVIRNQAALADVQTRLNDLTIRAPFTGVVSQRYAQAGAFVSPTNTSQGASASSSSILLLIDRLEVLATVAESDIARIRVGQPVVISSSAFPGQEFRGTVRLVAPEAVVENGITQFQVRIKLDDRAAQTLKSRLNVSVNFIAGKIQNALVVPTTAIITREGKTAVLIPDLKKGPTLKEVTTGQSLGDKTQILSGLKVGEKLYAKLPPDVNIDELLGNSNAFR